MDRANWWEGSAAAAALVPSCSCAIQQGPAQHAQATNQCPACTLLCRGSAAQQLASNSRQKAPYLLQPCQFLLQLLHLALQLLSSSSGSSCSGGRLCCRSGPHGAVLHPARVRQSRQAATCCVSATRPIAAAHKSPGKPQFRQPQVESQKCMPRKWTCVVTEHAPSPGALGAYALVPPPARIRHRKLKRSSTSPLGLQSLKDHPS